MLKLCFALSSTRSVFNGNFPAKRKADSFCSTASRNRFTPLGRGTAYAEMDRRQPAFVAQVAIPNYYHAAPEGYTREVTALFAAATGAS